MKTGLLLGRFQPFHLGHLELIKTIIDDKVKPLVCIGSAQHSHTISNPFTAVERRQMITCVINKLNCKYEIFEIPDINNFELYVNHLKTFVPKFDIVYSGNPIVQRLFSNAGHKVVKLKMFNREAWEGSTIRQAMKEGDEWESAVPEQIVDIIHRVGGTERLENLA